jgi:Coenzyme PQQ synthesis protein D (PqqD)
LNAFNISESATVIVTDRQVACVVADETVILQLREGVYYGLNPVGTCIWRAVQSSRCVAEIVASVLAEFDVSRERCLADVRELLIDLEQHELVTLSRGIDS